MPITNNYIFKNVAGKAMLIPVSGGDVDMTKIFNLNEVGVLIYNGLLEQKPIDEIVLSITEQYNVDEETAKKDTLEFINKLKEKNVYYE